MTPPSSILLFLLLICEPWILCLYFISSHRFIIIVNIIFFQNERCDRQIHSFIWLDIYTDYTITIRKRQLCADVSVLSFFFVAHLFIIIITCFSESEKTRREETKYFILSPSFPFYLILPHTSFCLFSLRSSVWVSHSSPGLSSSLIARTDHQKTTWQNKLRR